MKVLIVNAALIGVFLNLKLMGQTQSVDISKLEVKVYITSQANGDRLYQISNCKFEKYPQPEEDEAVVFIDDSKTFQTYLGMGGAFTDASAETFYKLSKELQNEIITAYFDPKNGIGYNLR